MSGITESVWKVPPFDDLQTGASLMQLCAGEIAALTKYNEDEAWIWRQMIECDPTHSRCSDRLVLLNFYINRVRQLKELEAFESKRQEEYEKGLK